MRLAVLVNSKPRGDRAEKRHDPKEEVKSQVDLTSFLHNKHVMGWPGLHGRAFVFGMLDRSRTQQPPPTRDSCRKSWKSFIQGSAGVGPFFGSAGQTKLYWRDFNVPGELHAMPFTGDPSHAERASLRVWWSLPDRRSDVLQRCGRHQQGLRFISRNHPGTEFVEMKFFAVRQTVLGFSGGISIRISEPPSKVKPPAAAVAHLGQCM